MLGVAIGVEVASVVAGVLLAAAAAPGGEAEGVTAAAAAGEADAACAAEAAGVPLAAALLAAGLSFLMIDEKNAFMGGRATLMLRQRWQETTAARVAERGIPSAGAELSAIGCLSGERGESAAAADKAESSM